ncbi:MAG: sigma 54-interacting transcriptional regulator [Candidatus Eisenbacteria sp.]|nr:sigma 54-interacting transcriptional regulator [Candidatus Eisenbacteria bacterium]
MQISQVHLAADNPSAALESLKRAEAVASRGEKNALLGADLGIRIADCLRRRGELGAALERISEALDFLSTGGDPVLKGKALARQGAIQAGLGDYEDASGSCYQAYELLRASDEHVEIGLLELTLGTIHVRCGRISESQECFESALFTFRRIDHQEGIARALNNLGLVLKNGPRWADARDYLEQALAISQQAGNYARVASHCVNLGILYTKLCEWDSAEQSLKRGVVIHKEVGNTFGLTKALLAMGHLCRRRGRKEDAAARYAEARKLCQEHAYGREMVLCWEAEGDLFLDGGCFEEARGSLQQGLELAVHVAPEGDLVPELQRRLAAVGLALNDFDDATRLAARSARGARKVGDSVEAGAALRVLGEALSRKGLDRPASRALQRAVNLLGQTPARLELALAQKSLARHLAKVEVKQGSSPRRRRRRQVVDLLQEAWGFFISAELLEWAAETLVDLAEVRVSFGDLEGALRDIARAHALAEKRDRKDLLARLERIRGSLESSSAEAALLTYPEVEIIRAWTQLFSEGGAAETWFPSMLSFVADQLNSSAAILATPSSNGRLRVVARIGLEAAAARAILQIVEPHVGDKGIALAAGLEDDPRFSAQVNGILAGVQSFAALSLNLPKGKGLLYLDRRSPRRDPYGRGDLRVLSVLSGLLGLGLVQHRRERALERERRRAAQAGSSRTGPFAAYLTCDPGILKSFSHLERVGDSATSILVLGETGTGKGLLAQCIHKASSRYKGPFITVNCAAIPEGLLESELFGHVRGSFTGASRDKRGLFQEAHGGTIFLDEINRATLAVQAKLLHALDTREIRPVGATRGQNVDVRVICASNGDLRTAIRKSTFLEDLFYRLSDFSVHLPPLRERRGDIPLLLDHLFGLTCRELQRRPKGISREVKALLLDHGWRGNIRELIQVVRRLVALADEGEMIGPDLLPREVRTAGEPDATGTAPHTGLAADPSCAGLREQVRRLERHLISQTLDATRWNRSQAARTLSISYPSLLGKIKLFGLRPPR